MLPSLDVFTQYKDIKTATDLHTVDMFWVFFLEHFQLKFLHIEKAESAPLTFCDSTNIETLQIIF